MLSKITALTPRQISQLAEWRDRWLAIGLSTAPADRQGAREGVLAAYAAASLKAPTTFIWLRSPFEGAIASLMLKWASVGASVRDSVRASVGAVVVDSVVDSGEASVRASVRASVGDSVGAVEVCWGQHDAGWLSFYDYFRVVVGIDAVDQLAGLIKVAECCGWWWPRQDAVILTERPRVLARDAQGRLHSETSQAIEYPDGWGVYALRGVRVPALLVTTPAADLDPRLVLTERNAEIRREIVRKIGIERVCAVLGATTLARGTDHVGQPCELLNLNLGDGRRRPYIKLIHPGVGTYHLEGVPPECDTLDKAFTFRNGTREAPKWLR